MEAATNGGSTRTKNSGNTRVVESIKYQNRSQASRIPNVTRASHRRPWLVAILILVVSLVVIDVSSARIRYHYRLVNDLTPMKEAIETNKYAYHGTIPVALQNCHAYDRESGLYIHNCTLSACEQNALLLSETRQRILLDVRSRHPFAEWISEVFDNLRGVDQTDKISSLFSRKPCERIISSSDKTNLIIDVSSAICILIALYATWLSIKMIVTR
jgi:hypothetical protein